MTANQSYVIVGASLAGAKAAEAMRDAGFDGSVVIVGDERELPYERPPLSKGYLLGKDAREKAFVHAEEWYGDHDVALRLGTTVTGLHRSAHEIELSGGERIAYDKLLLATGSSPRKLQAPGADLAGVHYLRRSATPTRCARRSPAAGRSSWSAPGGSGWRWPRRPGTTGRRHRARAAADCRCTRRSGARSATSSPRCTATTVSTYAPDRAPSPSRAATAA